MDIEIRVGSQDRPAEMMVFRLLLAQHLHRAEPIVPRSVTQAGLADASGFSQSQISRVLSSLALESLVDVRRCRVAGEARRIRVYALTDRGFQMAKRAVEFESEPGPSDRESPLPRGLAQRA